jgi:hypothetical protein
MDQSAAGPARFRSRVRHAVRSEDEKIHPSVKRTFECASELEINGFFVRLK